MKRIVFAALLASSVTPCLAASLAELDQPWYQQMQDARKAKVGRGIFILDVTYEGTPCGNAAYRLGQTKDGKFSGSSWMPAFQPRLFGGTPLQPVTADPGEYQVVGIQCNLNLNGNTKYEGMFAKFVIKPGIVSNLGRIDISVHMSAGAFPGTKFDVRKKALPLDAKRLRNLNSDMPNLMSLTEDKPLILIGPEVSVVEKKGIF